MVMRKWLADGSPPADSKIKFPAWAMSWRPPGAYPHSFKWPKWTLQ